MLRNVLSLELSSTGLSETYESGSEAVGVSPEAVLFPVAVEGAGEALSLFAGESEGDEFIL